MLLNRQNKEKINHLKWFDILVLTLILWGEGIYTSTASYIALIQGASTVDDNLTFSATDNYGALALQAGLLLLALLYLWLRRFDFKVWTIRFNIKAVAGGVLIFLAAALLLDIYFMLTNPLTALLPFPGPIGAFFGSETVSSVIYALLNGVYEEIYFLGICLAVRKEHLKWALPFSLLIRVSFHTYQGMISALGIGLLFGIFMYLMYRRSKDRNLLPFFIAHAIGDIFGLGVLSYFWM
ncbi:CPBP family intramembrane metalloprotease [bacterium 210917-SL.2.15]|nr:CPBP family intramembrane metalloprotease [bacterium 210917-SL.2.15]